MNKGDRIDWLKVAWVCVGIGLVCFFLEWIGAATVLYAIAFIALCMPD